SGATSPGAEWREDEGDQHSRYRPRTYPYHRYLPYEVEDEAERQRHLDEIVRNLYIAIESRDFAPGAVRWTRELRGWLGLKFDPPRKTRAKLVRLYYELALAPGMDTAVAERFANMFMTLTKRKHYLHPGKDLSLDWRPLYKELKSFVLPQESGFVHSAVVKKPLRTLTRMCSFAQFYFDPDSLTDMFEEFLPYFTTSNIEGAFAVVGLLNLLMPTGPPPPENPKLQPTYYLPTLFNLWSMVNRSKTFDVCFLDLLSRLARDMLLAKHVPFGQHGIFTKEQSSLIFTAILRLLEIPVGQATSAYSQHVDSNAGMAIALDRDQRKSPVAYHIARWVVMSLSPMCLDQEDSILSNLEGLIQAVETFFHPSNSGAWTKSLSQLVYYLADFFVMRWNRENSGEVELPEERRLSPELKDRFVLCLREVTFMGIYAKSSTAMSLSLSALQSLAFLQPKLILPGALQRIYPSMSGLVEVHRTTSSLRSLQVLSRSLVTTRGFRCHVTTLLGLALPGIDANDLDKTMHTLAFIQALTNCISLHDLTQEKDGSGLASHLAMDWVGTEVDRLEREGADVHIDYDTELTDEYEEAILRSSTAGFSEFIISFLGRVFTLLENLPDSNRVRSGSPEESVMNTLPVALTPLFAALSPELYDIALQKVVDFVGNHVIHQARDAMAFICNALAKVNPEKALKALVPVLVRNIRTEIDDNNAASSRNTGNDVLPRDRGLVWNISILSMSIVHVGEPILKHQQELFDIATYMTNKCKGIPTVHVSNFIHHLLLNLTVIYTTDFAIAQPKPDSSEFGIEAWGKLEDPQNLDIKWHVPSHAEIEFAVKLFCSQAGGAVEALESLTSDTSSIKRDGTGKEWSDEVTRNLVLLRLAMSGAAGLFDPRYVSEGSLAERNTSFKHIDEDTEMKDEDEVDTEADAEGDTQDDEPKTTHRYPAGYALGDESDPLYIAIHELRDRIGNTLHHVHKFLTAKQEDDVACFNALYSTYRVWFIDVGIERSAHLVDRITRLFSTDIQTFKVSGLRKCYPRPLLLRRSNLYHLQRLRHNCGPRPQSNLDKRLILDLAESCVSLYADVRRHAQSASESAAKVIIGARPLVIPPLLQAFQQALKTNDYERMKGAMYTIIYGTLAKTAGRNWNFAPTLIRCYIAASSADKPSVQKLVTNAFLQVMDYGRAVEKMVIVNDSLVRNIAPDENLLGVIAQKREKIQRKKDFTERKKAELAVELVELAKTSHWRTASRIVTVLVNLGLRFTTIAPQSLLELATLGTVDTHPGLRGLYSSCLIALFCLVELRATCAHDQKRLLLEDLYIPHKISTPTKREDPNWTKEFLASFAQPDAKYYVDHDYPGWLVWDKEFPAYKVNSGEELQYDEIEEEARKTIGKHLNRQWFKTFFGYLKQEPREGGGDRFRMASSMLLEFAFDLVRQGRASVTFEELKIETNEVLGDGTDRHEHRATAEILGAMVSSYRDSNAQARDLMWEYVFPIVKKIFEDGLTPENSSYWTGFLQMVLQGKDPRRSWPIVEWLSSFRLDMHSNAAFKESSKIQLLQQCIAAAGWHFQNDTPILEDFLQHLDHPYKGVREAMGGTLGMIYRNQHHVSHDSVQALMDSQAKGSPVGIAPYRPSAEFAATIDEIFKRLKQWRHERTPGQQSPSSYTSASKTVLLWLETTLSSHECTQLIPFFPQHFMPEMLHMMDIKEDPELMSLAYHVFRHLPNVPLPVNEDKDFISSLINIGTTSTLWHQRLRVLINMQVIYFRRLFLISREEQERLFTSVSNMLEDSQLEVRLGAAATLSGMIRCSPVRLREGILQELKTKFTDMLIQNPLPKRTGTGTPTPDYNRIVLIRHAAVLGLGALVQAFPYTSPPPSWLPEVLATLASRAAGDPGMVGKSVKTALGDFKKTRQDTWHVDVKAFSIEQLEDLEGVLWKSYFA
ncbi:putative proteasome activator subunit 4, partial [Sphaerosporella brunnea]